MRGNGLGDQRHVAAGIEHVRARNVHGRLLGDYARHNDFELVRILSRGWDVNVRDVHGRSPLYYAICLYDVGADVACTRL